MNAHSWRALGIGFVLAALVGGVAQADIDGSLTLSGGGLAGTGVWADTGAVPSASLSWHVVGLNDGWWQYSYELVVASKAVSHFSLQVTDGFNIATDLRNCTAGTPELGTYAPGPSNPNMPAGSSIFGLKFEDFTFNKESSTYSFGFESNHAPVLGNFYAKDGYSNNLDQWNALWNTGLDPAATNPQYIIRPDGQAPGISLTVVKYLDADGDGEVDADLANTVSGWTVSLDGDSRQTDLNGAAIYDNLAGLSHTISEADASNFTGILVFDKDNNFLRSSSTLPYASSFNNGDVIYIGNIPEPATMLLLAGGGAILALRRRRA